jgi:mono/diheme cytochrome c family protein
MLKYVAFTLLFLSGLSAYLFFSKPLMDDAAFSVEPEAIERGAYLVAAGGCVSCHESPESAGTLSGGHGLVSNFGTFYVPNITPDSNTGIGNWTAKEFLLAVKHGQRPQGGYYFPAFPYRSYSGLSDQDVLDMGSYLMTLGPVSNEVKGHETPIWLANWMMIGWNILADLFESRKVELPDSKLVRGAYLARNLGHCGECHTPRNSLGIPIADLEFAGATLGESHADAITADALAEWSEDDFAFFLFMGMKPDEEYVGGEMEAVIAHNTSKLTDEDRRAMAAFFKYNGPR